MGIAKIYRLANVLSLDVVAGSVCSAFFFGRIFSREPNPLVVFVLANCVWLIYTLDHLIDSRLTDEPSGKRHVFHRVHRKSLRSVAAISLLATSVCVFFLPHIILLMGLGLLAAVAIYLFLQRKISWLKEFTVALLYTAGVMVPSLDASFPERSNLHLVIAFALIAFLNLLIFSWFDFENDLRDGHRSAATVLGKNKTFLLICGICLIAVILLFYNPISTATILLLLMIACHVAIVVFRNYFSSHDRFRLAGDAIFFIPGILILVT
jgi:4-hydroxybenzoate polyprenyltransferase